MTTYFVVLTGLSTAAAYCEFQSQTACGQTSDCKWESSWGPSGQCAGTCHDMNEQTCVATDGCQWQTSFGSSWCSNDIMFDHCAKFTSKGQSSCEEYSSCQWETTTSTCAYKTLNCSNQTNNCPVGTNLIRNIFAPQNCPPTGCTENECCIAAGTACTKHEQCGWNTGCDSTTNTCKVSATCESHVCPAGGWHTPPNVCHIAGGCTDQECCAPKTCSTFWDETTSTTGMGQIASKCGTGKDLLKENWKVECDLSGCTEQKCCVDKDNVCTTDGDCKAIGQKCDSSTGKCADATCPDNFVCPAGMDPKTKASAPDVKQVQCQIIGQCTEDECCATRTCSKMDPVTNTDTCKIGLALKFDYWSINCPRTGCTSDACCQSYERQCTKDQDCTEDETCNASTGKCQLTNRCPSTYQCPAGMDSKFGWGQCSAPGQCTDDDCCIRKTCSDYIWNLGNQVSTHCGAGKGFVSDQKSWRVNCPVSGCDKQTCCLDTQGSCQSDDDCTQSEYCNASGTCAEKTCATAFAPGKKTCPASTVLMQNADQKKCAEDPRRSCWEVDCCVQEPTGPRKGPLCSIYPATFCAANEACYWPSFCQMGMCYDPSVTNIKAHIKMMYPNATFSNRRLTAAQSSSIQKALYDDMAKATGVSTAELKKAVNLRVPEKGTTNKTTGKMEFHATMSEEKSAGTEIDAKINQWMQDIPSRSIEVDGETVVISDVKEGDALEVATSSKKNPDAGKLRGREKEVTPEPVSNNAIQATSALALVYLLL